MSSSLTTTLSSRTSASRSTEPFSSRFSSTSQGSSRLMRTAWPRSSSTCGVVHAHLSLTSPLPLVGARADLIPALAPFQLVQNPRSMASYSACVLPRFAVDASSLSLGTRKPSLARRSGGAPHDLLTRPLIVTELTGCKLASPSSAGRLAALPPFR